MEPTECHCYTVQFRNVEKKGKVVVWETIILNKTITLLTRSFAKSATEISKSDPIL